MEKIEIALARQNVQQLALTALVMTNPDPGRFATLLEQMFAHGQIEWTQNNVAPAVRHIAQDFVGELLEIARQEAAQRASRHAP